MKKFFIITLLLIGSLLSPAKESTDQSIFVQQLLGKWKCTEFSRLEDMPKDMKFPVVEYTFEFLSGGKVISNVTIDGKVYPEETLSYLVDNKVIVMYDLKNPHDITLYEWRFNKGVLELDMKGSLPIRAHYKRVKKIVEQVVAPDS